MRFLSIVKAAENQGSPPHALLDAIAKLTEDSVTDGPFAEAKEVVGGYAVLEARSRDEALAAARTFMRLHQQHWPGWEGECEIRELCFLAP